MASEYLLQLKDISKSFGGVHALSKVSLNVKKGEIHALLGENGAGKSTLMKVLSGVHRPDSGEIIFEGKKVSFPSPIESRAAGIAIIYQEFSLIPYLTVSQNMFLGREIRTKVGLLDEKAMRKRAKETFDELGIDINPDAVVGSLSVAKQQFVEIAKAISGENIKILILDEPTSTLTPGEVEQLFILMRKLKNQGVAMIFISHHMDDIYAVADTVTCFRDGQYIGTGKVSEISVPELIKMIVGRTVNQEFPPKLPYSEIESRPVVLEATIQREKNLKPQKILLHKGEILGIAGLVGTGRTELARALIGADKAFKKDVAINGKRVNLKNPNEALECGIGLVPEDRKTQGAILPFSIRDNVVLNTISKNAVGPFVNDKYSNRVCEQKRSELLIKTPTILQKVGNLSGGNQQKVVIAKWLATGSDILIFDEPTRGIDVGAKSEIYDLMKGLSQAGTSLIMISSELPEIVGMSDMVYVMRSDEIVARLTGDDVNSEEIMAYATGGKNGKSE